MKKLLITLSFFTSVCYGQNVGTMMRSDLDRKQTKFVYNITDYNAVGDDATDNTTFIQAAVDAAHAAGGGKVFIPAGIFQTGSITWYPDVDIEGSNKRTAVLKSNSADPLIQWNDANYVYQSVASIRNLKLDGDDIGTIGLKLRALFQFRIEDVYVQHFTSYGAELKGIIAAVFSSVVFDSSANGVYAEIASQAVHGAQQPNLVMFEGCSFTRHPGWAVDWNDASGIIFKTTNFEDNGTANNSSTGSARFNDLSPNSEGVGVVFENCWLERNKGVAVLFNNPAGNTTNIFRSTIIQYPHASTTYGVIVNGGGSFDNTVYFTDGSKVDGNDVDVQTDGANATTIKARTAIITDHDEYSSGVFTDETTGGSSVWSEAGTIASYSKTGANTGAVVEAANTYAAYMQIKSTSGATLQFNANANTNADFGTATNHDLGFYTNGSYRFNLLADGTVRFPGLAGNGTGVMAIDNDGDASWSAGGGGSSQWTTTGNNVKYEPASGHVGVYAIAVELTKAAFFEANNADGVAVRFQVNGSNGELGTTTNHPLDIYTNGASRINISNAGALRFSSYGAGTLVTDGSGNVTASSDIRLKNIQGRFTPGLNAIMGVKPITYKWNEKSGMETQNIYAGFSAQNIKANIPLATGEGKDGMLTVQDRVIIAALVNAVKEQQVQIETLRKQVAELKK